MNKALPTIAVLGASGLIGEFLASSLLEEGFPVVPIARRFNATQKTAFGAAAIECPIVALDDIALARILDDNRVDIVVNCIGILQDGQRGSTEEVHGAFAKRLVAVVGAQGGSRLLIHLSIPGDARDDQTAFSRTKREAERSIMAGAAPFVVLRPGFVVAPAAYGGSALMRALAALPFDLSAHEMERSFAVTDATDIARTVAMVARLWRNGARGWRTIWDVMARRPSKVGDVIGAFRHRFGGPTWRMRLPFWLMELGAGAGDLIAWLGWSPPIRSTALREMRRGVAGDPEPWIAATGIEPVELGTILRRLPASVQEKWFARLYLTKPLMLASLVVFWIASGLIALMAAFDAATAILTSHGFPSAIAEGVTAVTSLADITIGLAIAWRKTCRTGLLLGIGLSLFYMIGAAMATPELWIEPLGALVKTGPAIVLMLVALAMLEDR